jgi:hypothetical protein
MQRLLLLRIKILSTDLCYFQRYLPFRIDHLLSYFLGESQASQPTNAAYSGSQNLTVAPGPQRMAPFTPAVQFYGSSSSKGSHPPPVAPLQSSSSSSSSLSSMAATLVNGGPVLHQYHQAQQAMRQYSSSNTSKNNSPPSTNVSPISPAATMGTPQEMLMLPPPPRNYGDGGAKSEAERQQHLAWLSQINTMAMMNRHLPPTPQDPQQQQPGMMMQPPPHYHGAPLAPTPVFHPPHHLQQTASPAAAESEERRARRLARNRESARQSRRRKKEHLARLSKQVNGLHEAIEEERRHQLGDMEENLQKLRYQAIQQLALSQQAVTDPTSLITPTREGIRELLDGLGPNCAVRQNCVSFQYSALKQLMLPKYQAFILWLTLQDENFFGAGKEEKAKNARVSSKQIGEELTNEWKMSPATAERAMSPTNPADDDDGAMMLQARADEAARLWPLFCFEISISVDQEDKLLNFHKRAQELAAKDRSEMSDATKMVMNMKKGILNHCQSTVGRSENIFSGTLSPTQSAAYFKWYTDNAELLKNRPALADKLEAPPATDKGEMSISNLCKRLTQVLTLPESSAMMVDERE